MAECQCGKVWLWNWRDDCFVNEDDEEYAKTELPGKGDDNVLRIWTCDCGRIGEAISHYCGECFGKNVDWEDDLHSY